jgi:hypothetical protein
MVMAKSARASNGFKGASRVAEIVGRTVRQHKSLLRAA